MTEAEPFSIGLLLIGTFGTSMFILWIIYGYPIYAMLKSKKMSLRKKEIELKLKRLK